MALVLTGKQKKKLADALEKAFRTYPSLNTLVMTELDMRLESITPPAAMGLVTLELVDWAEAEGKLDDLLRGAMSAMPKSPFLSPVILDFVLTSPGAPALKLQGELERQFLRDGDTKNFAAWQAKIDAVKRCVCLIQLHEEGELVGLGTGFLIAPDLIMTAHHVARELTGVGGRAVFDYLRPNDDVNAAPYADIEDDALVWQSPEEKLDCAVLRLSWPAGSGGASGPATRGKLSLRERPVDEGAAVLILQHPDSRPLEISIGGATSQIAPDRLHYTAGTEPGSSGSPVMTLGGAVIAVHHHADERQKKNGGTQMGAILAKLQEEAPELYSIVVSKPKPPPVKPSEKPVRPESRPASGESRPMPVSRESLPTGGDRSAEKGDKKLVYLSRALRDKAIADALRKHLAPLIRAGKIAVQDESDFPTGIDEAAERLRYIDDADMVVLFVSGDYLLESSTVDELDRVLPKVGDKYEKRGEQHVVPLLCRNCNVEHSPLQGKTYLPRDNEKGQRPINSPNADALLSEVAATISAQLFPKSNKQRPW